MDELEQCPFCGNKARIIFDKERVLIECIECMACVWEYCTDDARQAWNTRAQDKLLDDMGKELKELYDEMSYRRDTTEYTRWTKEMCKIKDLLTRYRALRGE